MYQGQAERVRVHGSLHRPVVGLYDDMMRSPDPDCISLQDWLTMGRKQEMLGKHALLTPLTKRFKYYLLSSVTTEASGKEERRHWCSGLRNHRPATPVMILGCKL